MTRDHQPIDLTDLADGTLTGPEWDAWLAEHPAAAAEVAIAKRVQALVAELRNAAFVVPDDFEARLIARIRDDRTLLDLLNLGLDGIGRSLLEIIGALLGLLPNPHAQPMPA